MVTGQGPVTITDVARLAGVSPGTASKALNGRRGISARTALRVQQAAERLGYQPNALARGLLSGRSFTVGLITTDSFGRFSIPVVQGVEDALGPGRILVFLCESRDDRLREQHYLQALLGRRVDGIIVTGRRQDRREPIGRDLRVPVVYAMAYSSDPADLSLVPDDEDGGALAIRHLLSTGRTSDRSRDGAAPVPGGRAPRRGRGAGARRGRAAPGRRPRPCTASGPRNGDAAASTCSCAPHPGSTPSSAATTRSPAAPPTGCARPAGVSPRTWPWWASTTGASSPPRAARRSRRWT